MVIRSGGQSGSDRAALDFAKKHNIKYKGWCPKGGWAEDYPTQPGLLTNYPLLTETPTNNIKQRTVWNVRDSDATLIITYDTSPGTNLTIIAAEKLNKPHFLFTNNYEDLKEWLNKVIDITTDLNVAGPRESERNGVYSDTLTLLEEFLYPLLKDKKII